MTIQKHQDINEFSLKNGQSLQPHALLALLSLSGFYPVTSLRESHQGGGVIEENNDQDRIKFWVLVTSSCQITNELNNCVIFIKLMCPLAL